MHISILKKHLFAFFFLMIPAMSGIAQHRELSETPNIYTQKASTTDSQSSTVLDVFRRSTISGHFRYFFMATNNDIPYTDYFANAIGGGLKIETAPFHHFRVGISGFYIFNIGSSDFSKPDSISKQMNRYESALFDVNNPGNKSDMDRLEELYLNYQYKGARLTFGKQMINTPFVNLQDGRMRPTGVEGLWIEARNAKKIKMELGYLYRISPRSTLSYYDIGKSIGIYSSGVNEDGSKSNYSDHLRSKGIFIAGISSESFHNTKFQIWNQWVENIFNTSMVQADFLLHKKDSHEMIAGLQSIVQIPLNHGGHEEINKSYFASKSHAFTFGAKLGWKQKNTEFSINYNRITASGRYLMPREWGREPFFTFLPRERNEGLGDVHAATLKLNYTLPSIRMKTNIGVGYYDLPSVKNYRLNKYGMPSYAQFNIDLRYEFAGLLKGFDAQLLLVHKVNASHEALAGKNVINKVDMTQVNAVLNFRY